MQKQRTEIEALHHSFAFQATKTAQGARAPMAHRSGQRKTPTATKASTPNSHGRQCRGNIVANLITVASSSPTATVDMPASACCTCDRAPYYWYSTPVPITTRHGQPKNPATAAAAPVRPTAKWYPTITVRFKTF